jgi:acetyltransferase-like isoleucine patch superfamily enzyme
VAHVRALELLGYGGSRDVHIDDDVHIVNPQGLSMGARVRLSRGTRVECLGVEGRPGIGRVAIGEHVFVGERTTILAHESISVGRLTMIAHNCSLMDFNHGTDQTAPLAQQQGSTAPVTIGENCWLGAGVIVLPGVTIGNGTIVGAGAVVAKSLPANVIAAGVPARVIRPR